MADLVRIFTQNQARVTSISLTKVGLLTGLFLSGKQSAHALESIPGLVGVIIYRSVDRQQIAEYLQWTDLAAFEMGIQSDIYRRHRLALGDETGTAAIPCEVVLVDDARPGIDQFDSLLITGKDDYITLVSVFEVQPGRREELLDLLRRDHESFLSQFEGFVAVAFHKALHDENKLMEVLQFESLETFKAVADSTVGAAHLAAVARLTTAEHNLFMVHSLFGPEDAGNAFA